MTKVLISTYGVRGDIAPYLAIARELKDLGVRPVIATARAFREMIETAGIEWRFCPPEAPNARRIMSAARGDERLVREHLVPSLRSSVAALDELARNCDVLVSHTLSFAGPIVAARRDLPWVSSAVSPLALLEPELSPALPIAPWAANFPRLNNALLRLLRRQFGVWLRPVQALRRELDLLPGDNALWHDAHSPRLALRLWSPRFCEAGARPGARASGFCFLDEAELLAPDLENWLKNGDAPIVICAASGCGNDRWLRDAAHSARALGKRVLILGAENAPADDGIFARPFAPLEKVLPRATALIHGGGIGTLALAWRAQTPMLMMPSVHDQFDNDRRALQLGIAHQTRAPKWLRIMEDLLADDELKKRVTQSGALIAREDGARAAAMAITEVLK